MLSLVLLSSVAVDVHIVPHSRVGTGPKLTFAEYQNHADTVRALRHGAATH